MCVVAYRYRWHWASTCLSHKQDFSTEWWIHTSKANANTNQTPVRVCERGRRQVGERAGVECRGCMAREQLSYISESNKMCAKRWKFRQTHISYGNASAVQSPEHYIYIDCYRTQSHTCPVNSHRTSRSFTEYSLSLSLSHFLPMSCNRIHPRITHTMRSIRHYAQTMDDTVAYRWSLPSPPTDTGHWI